MIGVSILVLVEVLPWDGDATRDIGGATGFQSLFWWKYCPGRLQTWEDSLATRMFQSLFWWKYCPGDGIEDSCMFSMLPFQSLFWWKYCPGRTRCRRRRCRRGCFNPCSGGSIALGSVRHKSRRGVHAVSILVLVEVLPWASVAEALGGTGAVSILVLVEVLPWARPDLRSPLIRCSVSILVLVEVLPWVSASIWLCGRLALVSILVLVEVLPWAERPGTQRRE